MDKEAGRGKEADLSQTKKGRGGEGRDLQGRKKGVIQTKRSKKKKKRKYPQVIVNRESGRKKEPKDIKELLKRQWATGLWRRKGQRKITNPANWHRYSKGKIPFTPVKGELNRN